MNFYGKYAWEPARGVCCFISFINFEYISSESNPILASAASIQEAEAQMQILEARELWFFVGPVVRWEELFE